MDAWGTGVFDNDTACDRAHGLDVQHDQSLIDRILEEDSEIFELCDDSGRLDERKREVDDLRLWTHLTWVLFVCR